MDEETAEHRIGLLTTAILSIGKAAGVLAEDVQGISGPEALMFAEDTAAHVARLRETVESVQAYATQCAVLRTEPSTAGLRKALPPNEQEVRAILHLPEDQRTDEHRERLRRAGVTSS